MSAYPQALDLLNRAMAMLDELGDHVIAAHLATAIDLVERRIAAAGSGTD